MNFTGESPLMVYVRFAKGSSRVSHGSFQSVDDLSNVMCLAPFYNEEVTTRAVLFQFHMPHFYPYNEWRGHMQDRFKFLL